MKTFNIANEAQIRSFEQIEVKVDPEYGVLWIYQDPKPRPCFNPDLVSEIRSVQLMLEKNHGKFPYNGELIKINYLVLDSKVPGIFSMGGDLSLFHDHITRKDKEGFLKYVKVSIDAIHDLVVGCRLPITTISLVRGDALGGGFEVALSTQYLIAERQVELGFPEVLFNLFPGMGGYHFLSQRLPVRQVERMMLDGKKYSSDDLYEKGVIDKLADQGQGVDAVYSFIKECNKYRNTYLAMKNVREKINPVSYDELLNVCNYWVDVSMNLSDKDLKLIHRLVKAQDKKANETNVNKYYERKIA